MNNVYNGLYVQHIEITVKSDNHKDCLYYYNKFKHVCDAFITTVEYSEHKSARKGPVLERTLMVKQIAYHHSIIIFAEVMRILQLDYSIFAENTTFIVAIRAVEPFSG